MSQIMQSQHVNPNLLPISPASLHPILKPTESLIEQFGPEVVGNAATQTFVGAFTKEIKQDIIGSDMPGIIKDSAVSLVNKCMGEAYSSYPIAQEAETAVLGSELESAVRELVAELIAEYRDEGRAPTTEAPTVQIQESAAGSTGSAPAANPTDEASAEAAAESLDEQVNAAFQGLLSGNQESEEAQKAKGVARSGNFLEALAAGMAETQSNFLDRAKQHSDAMANLSKTDNASSKEFTTAQAKYTALMQMFNIYSNQVATTLKTLGEAMASIARKQ